MSNTMSNGGRVSTQQFYEALIEQNTLREEANKEINDKLDNITSSQSAAEERFKAINDKVDTGCLRLDKRIDKSETRLDNHDDDFKEVRRNQKWLGVGEGGMLIILGWLGLGK